MTAPLIYDGTGQAAPEKIPLRAGKLTMLFERGSLRYLRFGDTELLRMIYAAVRDHNWDTIPGSLTIREQTISEDSFRIVFEIHHLRPPVDFSWVGTISGNADGSVSFELDGQVNRRFDRNRIGFCILHPAEAAGLPCRVEHVDGSMSAGHFPVEISPHQPFFAIRAVNHDAAPGVQLRVVMEGETFEMEDQRNWTDASFKTYCTPLELPMPVTVQAGERIRQTVRVQLLTELPEPPATEKAPVVVQVGEERTALPEIGLGMATGGERLSAREAEHLRALGLAHLRVTLRLVDADAIWEWERAKADADALDAALELAVKVSENADPELERLAGWLDEAHVRLARIAVFHTEQSTTPEATLRLAREKLGRFGVPVGGGTDSNFTEVNRQRPVLDALDFVTYSMTPQVHAFDNTSLVETLAGQPATVATARTFSGEKPIRIGSIVLKPLSKTTGKPQEDARQNSLFGAGWTLGSIKQMAASGIDGVTYYETHGGLGVMGSDGVFPMWYVFERVGSFADDGYMLMSESSDPLRIEALALRGANGAFCLMVANLTEAAQAVELRGLPDAALTLRLLDETSTEAASRDPFSLRSAGTPFDGTALTLPPYALAMIETETR